MGDNGLEGNVTKSRFVLFWNKLLKRQRDEDVETITSQCSVIELKKHVRRKVLQKNLVVPRPLVAVRIQHFLKLRKLSHSQL